MPTFINTCNNRDYNLTVSSAKDTKTMQSSDPVNLNGYWTKDVNSHTFIHLQKSYLLIKNHNANI